MDVVAEVAGAGGAMRLSLLPWRQVAAAVRRGELTRPHRRVVALPTCDAAVAAAVAAGGVPSCSAAARLHGLPLLHPDPTVHVTVPRSRSAPPSGPWVIHRRDVPVLDGLPRLDRVAADCALCLPTLDAVVVLDAVLARGVDVEEIAAHLRGRGSGAARAALDRADGRSGSVGESVARVRLLEAGIAATPQAMVPGVGWVDLLVAGWLVIEIDGFGYHSGPAEFAHDRRRDAALIAQGFVVLRFTHNDVVHRPQHLVSVVRQVLAAAVEPSGPRTRPPHSRRRGSAARANPQVVEFDDRW